MSLWWRVGLGDPAACFGVGGQCFGVDALGGEDGQGAASVWKLGQCSQMLA